MGKLFTIGHSQHDIEYFIKMLRKYNVNYVLDVRSTPYSKYAEQYNRENIEKYISRNGIRYSFMGKFFGARPSEKELYCAEGYLDFERVRKSERFIKGFNNVMLGLQRGYNIAFMCTEKDPFDCDSLIYSIATVLNAALTLSDVDDEKKLECNNVIVEWLERTAESPNEKVRISSIFMLAAKYIQMEKYKEANIFLDKIPDTVIDATIMKTNVLAHQEGTDIAAFFLEGKLMQTVTNIQNYLYKLIEMEEETGNHCKAEKIAEITEHMVSLFGLWDYGKVVPYLLIAVYRKDVEKCIQLIKEVLMESQKPWKMVESPLYYRYVDTVQGKSFSGVGNNFVRALATEIENKEEYEFLKGNKELEAIFSQYLK